VEERFFLKKFSICFFWPSPKISSYLLGYLFSCKSPKSLDKVKLKKLQKTLESVPKILYKANMEKRGVEKKHEGGKRKNH
jgi:hypothetical protein